MTWSRPSPDRAELLRTTKAKNKLQSGARSTWIDRIRDLVLPALFVWSCAGVFASIALTDSVRLPLDLTRWAIIPCFGLSLVFLYFRPGPTQSFADAAGRVLRSWTLWGLLVYLSCLIAATNVRIDVPDANVHSLTWQIVGYSVDVFVFVWGTAYLAMTFRPFLRFFFVATAAILAINAAVNLIAFAEPAMLDGLIETRLRAAFGTPGFVNSTHVGPLWVMYGLAALALVATADVSRIERLLVTIAAPILFCATLATQSRGAVITLVVGLVMIAAVASRRWRIVTASVLAAALLACLIDAPLRDALLSRGMSFRTELWYDYIALTLQQSPLMGFGLQREVWVKIDDIPFEQPHNTVVWAYVRGGVGAVLACLCMMASAFYWSVRHWLRTANFAPLIAITALLITSVTEIGFLPTPANWFWIMFWFPLGIAAGIELIEQHPSRSEARRTPPRDAASG